MLYVDTVTNTFKRLFEFDYTCMQHLYYDLLPHVSVHVYIFVQWPREFQRAFQTLQIVPEIELSLHRI